MLRRKTKKRKFQNRSVLRCEKELSIRRIYGVYPCYFDAHFLFLRVWRIKALTVRQVADLLGHSTTQVTEMYYVKKDNKMLGGITDGFCL